MAAVTVTHPSSTRDIASNVRKRQGSATKAKPRLKTVNDLMKAARKKPENSPKIEDDEEVSTAENEDDHQEDDFLVSDTEENQAAVKNAQLATSHVIDVDIDGGWKEGSP